jgi:hypothetical protein
MVEGRIREEISKEERRKLLLIRKRSDGQLCG